MSGIIKAVSGLSASKKFDLIMATLLVGIMEFRLGTYIMMCITSETIGTAARWVVGIIVAIAMVAVFVFFGLGTLFESQGEQNGTTRADYLEVMKYCSGSSVGIMAIMSFIYIANMDVMYILGYSSIPCIIAMLALYLIYRIKYNEEVVAYDK